VTIAERDGATLRRACAGDLPCLDALTVLCYAPIQSSFEAMLGPECYRAVRREPEVSWEERKCAQVRRHFESHPDWVWVLDQDGEVFGYVTFYLRPERSCGAFDNNGVHPARRGEGWGVFMYRHVLAAFRAEGLRFAYVETGLDDAHIPARRAYEAVGFDRAVPVVEYWQDLAQLNPRSELG
jgi:ribosomal protein S18 acetylase RimI-like enzyme